MKEIAIFLFNTVGCFIMLSAFLLVVGIIMLGMIKSGRWILLRIGRELKRPAEAILKPSKMVKAIDRHFSIPPKIQEVKKVAKKEGKI